MKPLYIISIFVTIFFSCNRNHSARELFDLAKEYENNAENELAIATYKQASEAAKTENDTALLGLTQQYIGMLLLVHLSSIQIRLMSFL